MDTEGSHDDKTTKPNNETDEEDEGVRSASCGGLAHRNPKLGQDDVGQRGVLPGCVSAS